MTEAKDWAAEFRGRNSGSIKATTIMNEIRSVARFFQYRLTREEQSKLNYTGMGVNGEYVFAAWFWDDTWLLGILEGDEYMKTRARQATKKQTALLESWFENA